jgi:A/G-specific adenine glycosylase
LNSFARGLISWYETNQRDLPWRKTKSPYRIWLSEIILQQTRIDQGMSYYHKFIEAYPNLRNLAQAEEQDVLKLWQGLGYYSRARNLLKTARLLQEESNFPQTAFELQKLPGVGPYTSAAIASFAFGEASPVLDGNVFRFISRYRGILKDPNDPKGKKEIMEFLHEAMPKRAAASFNQALMEFGSLQCKPLNPDCSSCPFSNDCFAFQTNRIEEFPAKKKKVKRGKRFFNYLVYQTDELISVQKRSSKDIWAELYQFPLVESDHLLSFEELEVELLKHPKQAKIVSTHKRKKHLLSHLDIHSQMVQIAVLETFSMEGVEWVETSKIDAFPWPRIIDKFLEEEDLLVVKNSSFVRKH